jgi:hypothetical protein
MSLTWIIIGSVAQLFLAFFLFMVVAFSAAGIMNNGPVGPVHSFVLNLSIYALPLLCFISAGIVISHYYRGGSNLQVYWWYLVPVVAAVIYLVYAVKLNK